MGVSFSYQGRLIDGSVPANGAYDVYFSLYDSVAGGVQVGSTLARDDVPVVDGYFAVELDFDAAFHGSALWVEVEVRPGDERGRYLYREVYGRSAQDSVWYAISPNARTLIDHPEALQRPGPDALRSGDAIPAQPPGR